MKETKRAPKKPQSPSSSKAKTKIPIPLPSPPKPKGQPAKPPVSQEFVNSSDDSADDAKPKSKPDKKPAKAKLPVQIAVHRPKTNGAVKSTPKSTSKSTAKTNGTPKAQSKTIAPPKVPIPNKVVGEEQAASSSSSEESEDESEEATKQQDKQIVVKTNSSDSATESSSEESEDESSSNGQITNQTDKQTMVKASNKEKEEKREAESSSAEGNEDERSSSRDVTKKQDKRASVKTSTSRSSSGSGRGSGSGSTSESSSDESEPETSTQKSQGTVEEPAASSEPQSHTVAIQRTEPYKPPQGFLPYKTDQSISAQSSRIFENLEGKQVWHITAPANIPLQEIREIAMDKVTNGDTVITHKDVDYGFSATTKSENATRKVLLPHQSGYKAAAARISQTLHLQQLVRLPQLSSKQADQNTGSEAAGSITRSTVRAPREQVKGLKMRFFPIGTTSHMAERMGYSDSEEDEDMAEPAGLGIPNGVRLPSKPEKRKHEGTHDGEGAGSPVKKHKKHRSPEEVKRKVEKNAKKEKKKHDKGSKVKS